LHRSIDAKGARLFVFVRVFETMIHFILAVIFVSISDAVPLNNQFSNQQQPSFPLKNAAVSGLAYPAVGLGTGGYGLDPLRKYPQCWIEAIPGCGEKATAAVTSFLKIGGRRIDSADSYANQKAIGKGIKESGVPREQVFITSKVGPSQALGYNDTLDQMQSIKAQLGVQYVDMLLIHWPIQNDASAPQSTDPSCQNGTPSYDARTCRLNTWRAMLEIFKNGDAKGVGVANYNVTHLQEIKDAGMMMPSVNQCPFNIHRSTSQQETIDFCNKEGILFNSYSSLGIPDLTGDHPKTSALLLHR
jgi:diketogulonate reductase-like aldo/keto reductase